MTKAPLSDLDTYEAGLAENHAPADRPHARAVVLEDGTVVTMVGPHAFVLFELFLAILNDEEGAK